MKDWYTWVLALCLGGIGWMHISGGGTNDGVSERLKPGEHNVRSNRGSYRSHYSSGYGHIGGK